MIASGHFLNYVILLLKGLGITLELSLGALVLGSLGGIVLGAMRGARWRPVRALAFLYVEAVRNVPLLVVLYVLFYALPANGIRLDAFTAGVIGLAINSTAFTIAALFYILCVQVIAAIWRLVSGRAARAPLGI